VGPDPWYPARLRLSRDLLAWGQPRPRVPEGFVEGLRDRLASALMEIDPLPGPLTVTRSSVSRSVCDGLQRDPRPFEHTAATVRGVLARSLIARDLDSGRDVRAPALVGEVWRGWASRRPGDPGSVSWWLNHAPRATAGELEEELVELLEGFREVWPRLAADRVVATTERSIRIPLAGGRVVLRGVPDLVLGSPVSDDRARSLVVDMRTGLPRPERDRVELRFHALIVTLADGRPPFRWATYHVTEGRVEAEDLSAGLLVDAGDRVVATVSQRLRLAQDTDGEELAAGPWCGFCARRRRCGVAASRTGD